MTNSIRVAYGEALKELAAGNEKIVVLDADLASATMTHIFKEAYPERFFDFGIAEGNMVCAAAGLAHTGLIPFASTFALFGTGRAYEEIRNSVCYVDANVKLVFTHAGLSVGEDGGSHQSIEDIALMRVLPGMKIFVPCDALETKKAVYAAAGIDGPVYIRLARPAVEDITGEDTPFVPGRANILRKGNDVCIIATGLMVSRALEAARILERSGIEAGVIDMHTIKPIDKGCILEMATRVKGIVTAEEHSIIGGLGSAVAEVLAGKLAVKFARVGISDRFGQSGTPDELFKEYGLTGENIAEKCMSML